MIYIYDIHDIYDIYDIYDSVCLLLVSFCRSVPPEFPRSFLLHYSALKYTAEQCIFFKHRKVLLSQSVGSEQFFIFFCFIVQNVIYHTVRCQSTGSGVVTNFEFFLQYSLTYWMAEQSSEVMTNFAFYFQHSAAQYTRWQSRVHSEVVTNFAFNFSAQCSVIVIHWMAEQSRIARW